MSLIFISDHSGAFRPVDRKIVWVAWTIKSRGWPASMAVCFSNTSVYEFDFSNARFYAGSIARVSNSKTMFKKHPSDLEQMIFHPAMTAGKRLKGLYLQFKDYKNAFFTGVSAVESPAEAFSFLSPPSHQEVKTIFGEW